MASTNLGRVQGTSIWAADYVGVGSSEIEFDFQTQPDGIRPLVGDYVLFTGTSEDGVETGDIYCITSLNIEEETSDYIAWITYTSKTKIGNIRGPQSGGSSGSSVVSVATLSHGDQITLDMSGYTKAEIQYITSNSVIGNTDSYLYIGSSSTYTSNSKAWVPSNASSHYLDNHILIYNVNNRPYIKIIGNGSENSWSPQSSTNLKIKYMNASQSSSGEIQILIARYK